MFVASSHDDSDQHSRTSTSDSLQSWISWFCSLSGHEFYAEVPEDFMEDEFNLTGLSSVVPYYREALEMILDLESDIIQQDEEDGSQILPANSSNGLLQQLSVEQENDDGFWKEETIEKRRGPVDANLIEPYAIMLYGLIHQRYIMTRNGLRLMAGRYESEAFGVCPRVYCGRCPVIPVGRFDEAGKENVKVYCPSCLDIYDPSTIYQNVDGAHFGTTYAHLMFQSFSELVPLARRHIYQPRIVGFRINEQSQSGPRMQWLRMRPPEYTEPNDTDDYDNDQDDMDEFNLLEEEQDDQLSSYQPLEDTSDRLSQLSGQVENWHIQDSSINTFLRRWI